MRNLFWPALLIIVPLGGLVLFGHAYSLNSTDFAAWAQAVGSVSAIGIAIWLSHRTDQEEERAALGAAIVLAGTLYLRLRYHAKLCRDDNVPELTRKRNVFSDMIYAGRGVRLDLLPKGKAYHYLDLMFRLSEASHLAQQTGSGGGGWADWADSFESLASALEPLINELAGPDPLNEFKSALRGAEHG